MFLNNNNKLRCYALLYKYIINNNHTPIENIQVGNHIFNYTHISCCVSSLIRKIDNPRFTIYGQFNRSCRVNYSRILYSSFQEAGLQGLASVCTYISTYTYTHQHIKITIIMQLSHKYVCMGATFSFTHRRIFSLVWHYPIQNLRYEVRFALGWLIILTAQLRTMTI